MHILSAMCLVNFTEINPTKEPQQKSENEQQQSSGAEGFNIVDLFSICLTAVCVHLLAISQVNIQIEYKIRFIFLELH